MRRRVAEIVELAMHLSGLSWNDVVRHSRFSERIALRVAIVELARRHGNTYGNIARVMGKHHTTIMHHAERYQDDGLAGALVDCLSRMLEGKTNVKSPVKFRHVKPSRIVAKTVVMPFPPGGETLLRNGVSFTQLQKLYPDWRFPDAN